MRYARLLLLAIVATLAACASAGGGSDRPSRQTSLLTQQEILDAQYTNLYDVVSALRPHWLRRRGPVSINDPSAGEVVVYMNSVAVGGADYLRQLNVNDVTSVQYYSESEAGARFGLRQNGGAAIVVHTIGG